MGFSMQVIQKTQMFPMFENFFPTLYRLAPSLRLQNFRPNWHQFDIKNSFLSQGASRYRVKKKFSDIGSAFLHSQHRKTHIGFFRKFYEKIFGKIVICGS
jgi:hypothetical protein